MSQFCSWEEAFSGPAMPLPGTKKKKSSRNGAKEASGSGDVAAPSGVESFAPGPLPGAPPTERPTVPEVLRGPPPAVGTAHVRLDEGVNMQEFFPLPGETAEPEEWAKAFMLEPSNGPMVPRPDGAIAVAGKPTLWRNIPEPVPAAAGAGPISQLAPVPSEINQRLDMLTRQLESLTTPTPLQSTAELFLFVAIGLLVLLFIDTLLRFATTMATRKLMAGGTRGGYRMGYRWR